MRDVITIVTYKTFLLWVRNYKRNKSLERINKRGRPKTLEEICKLVVRLAKENNWGYVRILGELNKLGVKRLSKSNVKNILKEQEIAGIILSKGISRRFGRAISSPSKSLLR